MKTEFMLPPAGWKNLAYHPLSEIVGFGTGIDVEALAEHMKRHGYDEQESIILFRDGRSDVILDGRHKHKACVIADITPSFRRFVGTSPEAYVAKKAFRQHLSESQRAMIAASISNASRSKPSIDGPKNNEDAAAAMNVSEKSVERAKKVIANGTPALREAVKVGIVTVSDAAKVADEPAKVQNQAVKDVQDGKAPTAKKAAEEKKPKSGKPRFDEKGFDKAYGNLVRLVDARGNAMGKGPRFKKCHDILGEFLDAYKEWKKESA